MLYKSVYLIQNPFVFDGINELFYFFFHSYPTFSKGYDTFEYLPSLTMHIMRSLVDDPDLRILNTSCMSRMPYDCMMLFTLLACAFSISLISMFTFNLFEQYGLLTSSIMLVLLSSAKSNHSIFSLNSFIFFILSNNYFMV